MAFSVFETGSEESFDQFPGQRKTEYGAAQTDNVHVVVLDALVRRKYPRTASRFTSRAPILRTARNDLRALPYRVFPMP